MADSQNDLEKNRIDIEKIEKIFIARIITITKFLLFRMNREIISSSVEINDLVYFTTHVPDTSDTSGIRKTRVLHEQNRFDTNEKF